MEHCQWMLNLNDVEVLEGQPALGKGAFGIVYSARWKGIEVAAKRVHETLTAATNGMNGAINAAVKGFEDESDTMQRLRHPHLVQFLGVYYDDLERLHIVMEKMEESLADLLARSGGALFEMKIYSIGTDVTSALRYMHELPTPIAHRDVTPKNILLTADLRAKVSDLGACKYALKVHAPMTATLAPGNPKYMPPEALDGGRYAKYAPPAVDVYSLAIVLLEMFSGTDPEPSKFNTFVQCPTDPSKFCRVPEEERRSACFDRIPKDHALTKLISKCVAADHFKRPVMREIQDTLLALQGKHVPRARSKPLQAAMRASHQERTHPEPIDVYDDVSRPAALYHQYENVTLTNAGVPNLPPRAPPPHGARNPPRFSVDKQIPKQERLIGGAPQDAANGQKSSGMTPPTYRPLQRGPEPYRSPKDASTQQEGMVGLKASSQHAANGQRSISPESAVADQLDYQPLQFNQNGAEGESMKINEYFGLPKARYGKPKPPLMRGKTAPSFPTQNRVTPKGRTPWSVYQSQGVTPMVNPGPPLPPRHNPPRRPSPPVETQEPAVYDTIEDVDKVLKVTEPSKKKSHKSFINGAVHKRAALHVCQNELLVTQDKMSGQNDVVYATNTEGKVGWIADTHVQLLEPMKFTQSYSGDGTSSPGILHQLTYVKTGANMKAIQISSSEITKGNLETLTSLANTDIVAVDKQNTGAPAYFQIDFLKQRLVRVEGYLLQWTGVMGRFGYPLQWVVEMSLDGMNWKEVDRNHQKTTAKKSQYWAAQHKVLGRYLRISLLGTNSAENHMLCLSGIELYGDLYTSLPVDEQYI